MNNLKCIFVFVSIVLENNYTKFEYLGGIDLILNRIKENLALMDNLADD